MKPITDVLVIPANRYSDDRPDIVQVTIMSDDQDIQQYDAYAVRNMTLVDFLINEEEQEKARDATDGRFMLANGNDSLEDKILAHSIYAYAQRVKHEHVNNKQREHGQKSGEVRKQLSEGHYESLRTVFNEILSEDPNFSDYQIAKRLNDRGYLTVNRKEWHNTNVQALREYVQNNPAHFQLGKGR